MVKLAKKWIKFNLITPFYDFLIVVDCSKEEYHDRIKNFLLNLQRKLNSRAKIYICALGSGEHFEINNGFNIDKFLINNKFRANILAPSLEAVPKDKLFRLIIITSGRIFDISDFKEEEILKNICFVKINNSISITEGNFAENILDDNLANQIVSSYRILKIELFGEKSFPFIWNNPEYALINSHLVINNLRREADANINAGFVGPKNDDIKFRIKYADNSCQENRAEEWECKPFPDLEWCMLSEEETRILKACQEGTEYQCPKCSYSHVNSYIRCPNPGSGRILGDLVYDSVSNKLNELMLIDIRLFILFKLNSKDNKGYFAVHPYRTLLISQSEVAMWDNDRIDIYSFNGGNWIGAQNKWRQYQEISIDGEEIYAIAYR